MEEIATTHATLLEVLRDPKFATYDIEEYLDTMEHVGAQLAKIREITGGHCNQPVVYDIREHLASFSKRLSELRKQGKLIRFLTNNRLRKRLDKLNSQIGLEVKEFQDQVFTHAPKGTAAGSPLEFHVPFSNKDGPIPTVAHRTLPDNEGKATYDNVRQFVASANAGTPRTPPPVAAHSPGQETWLSIFRGCHTVDWYTFTAGLRSVIPLTSIEEFVLKDIIDHSNTGSVTQFKFCEFVKGFGDISECIANMMHVYNEEWFHGFVSPSEARRFLELEHLGTFLVRFSSSKPGSFVIEYVTHSTQTLPRPGEYGVINELAGTPTQLDNTVRIMRPPSSLGVNSVVVDSCPGGFCVATAMARRMFPSLAAVVKAFSFIFLFPFATNLTKEPWFHGDLTSDEVVELLQGQPIGTFLVRFSSQPGCFATSFVTESSTIGKSLIVRMETGYRFEASENQTIYPTLKALVKAYISAGFFKLPLDVQNHTSVAKKMMVPGTRATPGWVTDSSMSRMQQQMASIKIAPFETRPQLPPRGLGAVAGQTFVNTSTTVVPGRVPARVHRAIPWHPLPKSVTAPPRQVQMVPRGIRPSEPSSSPAMTSLGASRVPSMPGTVAHRLTRPHPSAHQAFRPSRHMPPAARLSACPVRQEISAPVGQPMRGEMSPEGPSRQILLARLNSPDGAARPGGVRCVLQLDKQHPRHQ